MVELLQELLNSEETVWIIIEPRDAMYNRKTNRWEGVGSFEDAMRIFNETTEAQMEELVKQYYQSIFDGR